MNDRATKTLLVSSLVLNVFLLGGIAGGAYQWFNTHAQARAVAAQPVALRYAAEALSPERQREFTDGIKLARREARSSARAARDDRLDVLRLLGAPQFDRAAIEAALNRTRDADIAVRTSVEQSVLDFAASLTPDERLKFVEGLERRGQWRLTQKEQARFDSATEVAGASASSSAPATASAAASAAASSSQAE